MTENKMPDCSKRQVEVYKGTSQFRCINSQAEQYREVVSVSACSACPVRKLLKHPKESCVKVHKESALIPLTVLNHQEGFPDCPFRYQGDKSFVCQITSLPVDRETCGRCERETVENIATFGDKVANYFGAVRFWVANGRPTRTKEEIEALFADHCSQCDRYDKQKHACKNCGCKVSTESTPLTNKLAMGTERCPLGRF